MVIRCLSIAILSASSIYSVHSKEDTTARHHNKPHANGVKADYTGALSAHDLWQDFGEEWGGSSTLPDGSENPNKIVGWGSASASAWTQSSNAAQPQQPQQPAAAVPQQPGGYQYSSGYTGGYQQQPGYSTGYSTGYSNPQSGFGYGYTGTGYDTSSGYTASGFGTGSTGQMPGGQRPIGAPPAQGQQSMGAIPGGAQGTIPGGAQGAMPVGGGMPQPSGIQRPGMPAGSGQTQSVSGKCPLPHRHRKPWALLDDEQKDIFIEGFQQIRKNGKLDVFAQAHAQHDLQNYVHYTSLFTFYHAYMVWELETAIRALGGKFACFTMPYYDWTLDAGKEDDPEILKSGLGGDGDEDNLLCVVDDETGFTWQTCSDYTQWRTTNDASEDLAEAEDADDNEDKNPIKRNNKKEEEEEDKNSILHPMYIDYGGAYDEFEPRDDDDPSSVAAKEAEEAAESLAAEELEEQCFWSEANCKKKENAPFCCLKRKKSSTVLLPSAAEIGDAMYRAKNIKEFQGYLGEYYNKVAALFGSDYFAQMANGYATEDPIFWMTMSFMTHLRSLWQDCWNYNNIPKDKLDMHYNSYHPYCGTFDAQPSTCSQYNLGLDAPMNFYEVQKEEWSLANHKIITVRKMWAPEYWNVIYELGAFYTSSGINNWCDNTRDSEWFIETMDYDVDVVNTEINVFSQRLREMMIKDGVEESGVFKTVAALTCKYNRMYSANSCYNEDEWNELDDIKETCDSDDIDNEGLEEATLDSFLEMDGVSDNECLKRIRSEIFPYSEHALQVKKQLCKGDWDYSCPQYNELLYSKYETALNNPIDIEKSNAKNKKSFLAKTGWIWIIVINAILVLIVAIGCGAWHCSRSKTVSFQMRDETDGVMVDDEDDDDDKDGINETHKIQTIQENEEYQPLLV